jgi:uncharacterized membrane protein
MLTIKTNKMETVIKVRFKHEGDAFAAKNALLRANNNFDIELGETYVIKKNANGTADIRSEDGESTGEGILGGAAFGGLVGLPAGPVGVGLGMISGMIAGGVGDVVKEEDMEYYLDKFAEELSTDETMLVAHLWEYSTHTTDDILKPYGGTATRLDVDKELYKEQQAEIDAIDKQIAASEAAWAAAKAEDKAAFEAKLNLLKQKREDLRKKIKTKMEKRNASFKTWASSKKNRLEAWKMNMDDKKDAAKRDRLQRSIDRKAEELEELQEKYQAI